MLMFQVEFKCKITFLFMPSTTLKLISRKEKFVKILFLLSIKTSLLKRD